MLIEMIVKHNKWGAEPADNGTIAHGFLTDVGFGLILAHF